MKKNKILMVDDETDFVEIMTQRIESWGYQVISASNGKEALDLFTDKKPDVIILDYLMPDINGIDLLKKIRILDRNVPVLMFSAKAETENVRDGMDLGIAAFIPKLSPFADTQANLRTALDMVFKQKLK
ncbi:response regulator [bacterium]|nr:response regulator [bacterium]